MKYVIEVHHQTGITEYECENFWDIANIDYVLYENKEELIQMFGSEEEVPSEALELISRGMVIEIINDNSGNKFFLESEFDKEDYAFYFLGEDLNRLIVIETAEDAEFYANEYKDHEWVKVQTAAKRILELIKDKNK
jgi:hypothetical protein